ncbi:MAG: crossover junction endodeoxyribonuclease RuvC [Candidatus Liptonbacteria bacterium CG11_big_fil_rev_8_21_14_0_20_35_14]|uniref:Crossover junction endodeoxyribonuclease RuvC n=1 Tax=Candidatus Liptonbacteria bacterium CG11_big_fil_rev_8_21_14_0_20_35_14 TaxID=1974634 RepID=A0A2H0N7X2_9BACT|nr:MAG: crossover junction endodeoxyribonuclease RuvC [Candidatus Liptonbacteria bacterium CG11_big_fil_rev_8_21_14_0_20_35_14]
MIFLGIDPGTKRAGFGVIAKQNGELKLLDAGLLKTESTATGAILEDITNHLEIIIKKYKPIACAIETLFFSKNQKTAIAVAEARGAIILTIQKNRIPLIEINPNQLKQYVTGYGSANKNDIKNTVELILKTTTKEYDDALDALALAIIASSNNII